MVGRQKIVWNIVWKKKKKEKKKKEIKKERKKESADLISIRAKPAKWISILVFDWLVSNLIPGFTISELSNAEPIFSKIVVWV